MNPRALEPKRLVPSINQLVQRAESKWRATSHVRTYARLLVAARQGELKNELRDQHFVESRLRAIASLYGVTPDSGGLDAEQVRKLHMRGRQARQQVGRSAASARAGMKGLEKVLSRNFASLPQVTQEKFPPARIQAVVNMLTELVGHTEHIGPNELNRRPPELDKTRGRTNPPERLTLAKQTLLWWYFLVPSHPARWDEMYHLAKAWHLTASKDVESFRRYVLKCAQGVTRLVDPPHWTGV